MPRSPSDPGGCKETKQAWLKWLRRRSNRKGLTSERLLALLVRFLFFAAVAVADRSGAQLLVLDNPGPTQHDAFFGRAVAGLGDLDEDGVPELAVGAPGQFVAGTFFQGQVFVFSGRTGALVRTLDDPRPGNPAYFGLAVAGIDDVNGDARPDVLVGAQSQTVGANRAQGQAFVFSGHDGALLLTLDDPVPLAGALFGGAVTPAGDIDRDGVSDLAIAAPNQNTVVHRYQGQVFVFSGASGVLLRTIDHPEPQDRSHFGSALATGGDLDGDGTPDLIVGAPGQDGVKGAAIVVSGASGSALRSLHDPDRRRGGFGSSVASVGDVDGDGAQDLVVGAPRAKVGLRPQQGEAFLFSGRSGELLTRFKDPEPVADSFFGFAVSGLGDVNADGTPDVVVSAEDKTVGDVRNQGQVFVFSGRDGALITTLDNPHSQRDTDFGTAVAAAGDVNGDGIPDVVIGAPSQDFKGEIVHRLPGDERPGILWFGQAFVLSAAGVHDLAVTHISAPARVALDERVGERRARVRVKIQNRGPGAETVTDPDALRRLVTLTVESLGTCAGPPASLADSRFQPPLPPRLEPRQRAAVVFDVTFSCANDRTEGGPDYRYRAAVSCPAFEGLADSHPADDRCPRGALAFSDRNAGPGAKLGINDRGCGGRSAAGAYGADVVTDITTRSDTTTRAAP